MVPVASQFKRLATFIDRSRRGVSPWSRDTKANQHFKPGFNTLSYN
jgi:hypothetical protein